MLETSKLLESIEKTLQEAQRLIDSGEVNLANIKTKSMGDKTNTEEVNNILAKAQTVVKKKNQHNNP